MYTGSWGDHDGIIHCKLGEIVHYDLGEEPEPRREAPVFDKPTRGTSVEKFREMVFNHLKVKYELRCVQFRQNASLCESLNGWKDSSLSHCLRLHSLSSASKLTSPASSARSCLSLMGTKTDECRYRKPALPGPFCRWTRYKRHVNVDR